MPSVFMLSVVMLNVTYAECRLFCVILIWVSFCQVSLCLVSWSQSFNFKLDSYVKKAKNIRQHETTLKLAYF